MKVLDLTCAAHHRFEGWFGSDNDFESQMLRHLVTCPVCDSADVTRLPSAPRLNLSGALQAERAQQRRGERGAHAAGVPTPAAVNATGPLSTAQHPPAQTAARRAAEQQAQGAWLSAMRELVANTENVGERFADEARRMHYDEAAARSISGVASRSEFMALREEGIEVLPLPIPDALKKPLQ